jgi:thymidylate kinase
MPVLLVSLEGVIGVGKSTQLDVLKRKFAQTDDVIIINDPEEQFLLQGLEYQTLSIAMFHVGILSSMIGSLMVALNKKPRLILTERSMFSVVCSHAKLHLSGSDLLAYEFAFDQLHSTLPPVEVVCLHLTATVDTALSRTRSRNDTVTTADYCIRMMELYEGLQCGLPKGGKVITVDSEGTREQTANLVWNVLQGLLTR